MRVVAMRPTSPIHLLLGKRELIGGNPAPATGEPANNWQDLTNRWVTIFPQSGLITSSEMSPVDPAAATDAQIIASRQIALEGRSMGGR